MRVEQQRAEGALATPPPTLTTTRLERAMAAQESKTCLRCKQSLPHDRFHRDKNRKDGRYPYCKRCHIAEVSARQSDPARRARKRDYDRDRVARLKDKLREQYRANYVQKRAVKIANATRWASANPEKRRLIKQSYRHRRRAVERDGMGWKELRDWKANQPKVCHWCSIDCAVGYVVDHVQPLAKGGKHEAHNLVISCRPCNARKSARDPVEFAKEVGRSSASPDMLQ